jgi:predicted XRE-type DNA-binding protein
LSFITPFASVDGREAAHEQPLLFFSNRGQCAVTPIFTTQRFVLMRSVTKRKKFTSVWDAVEDTTQAAVSMKARSTLMMELSSYIENQGLTQAQAVALLGVTQPRVSDLMRGKWIF